VTGTTRPAARVAYVYPFAFQYRAAFHEQLRAALAAEGIGYNVIACPDPRMAADRGDLVRLAWATETGCTKLRVSGRELRYQHALRVALAHDLIIVQQENGLLLNYPLQLLAPLLGKRVAFFGHGRNFQSRAPDGLRERFKRFWTRRVDWWFAYTSLSAEAVRAAGFPNERITVFNNTLDLAQIARERAAVSAERVAARRAALGSSNVGVFMGALYPDKRLGFLLEAAALVRRRVPDFQLLIAGGGVDAPLARAAAERHDWVHYLGPQFGVAKAELLALGRVLLIPGLVGLTAIDAFAYGLPLVTTAMPYHGPEIAYVESGRNGVIVPDDVQLYADAVVALLTDEAARAKLLAGMAADLETYSMSRMVARFAEGVRQALAR
jgi:glycosyltransferase involved in cell wall biosynthesis